jgi:hypothetical protein
MTKPQYKNKFIIANINVNIFFCKKVLVSINNFKILKKS